MPGVFMLAVPNGGIRSKVEAAIKAIVRASVLGDCNVAALRTSEITAALLDVLGMTLCFSPSATRSPTAIRRTLDELGKHLRRRIAKAEADPGVQDFLRRVFRGLDVGGHA